MTADARRDAVRRIVAARGGRVPSLRHMADLLTGALGHTVSHITVSRDYKALGLRREPAASQAVRVSLPATVFDAYCKLARQRGVSVQSVVRAAVLERADLAMSA